MQTLVLVSLLHEQGTLEESTKAWTLYVPWFFTYKLLYEEMRVALYNSWKFVIMFRT